MHVAIVQPVLQPDQRSANQRQILTMLQHATDLDPSPEVVCLPSLCDTGGSVDATSAPSQAMSDAFGEVLAAQARDMGVSLVAGFSERCGQALYDTAAWYDADGDRCLRQRRITTGDTPYTRGSALAVHPTLFGTVALLHGPDALHTIIVDALALLGAQVVIVPTCDRNSPDVIAALRPLATNHGLWFVYANSIGEAGDGHSCIIDPAGNLVAAAKPGEATIITFAVQPEPR